MSAYQNLNQQYIDGVWNLVVKAQHPATRDEQGQDNNLPLYFLWLLKAGNEPRFKGRLVGFYDDVLF